MKAAQIGSISEAAVKWDLLRRGYNVLTPEVTSRYDLVATSIADPNRLWIRVQVKTARIDRRDGNLRVSYDRPYDPSEVDLLAVFDPHTGTVYYIPIEAVPEGAKGFTLRLTQRKYKRRKTSSLDAQLFLGLPRRFLIDNHHERRW